ncbi:MAG: Mut7-C RNAse domain-containing protein [Armatimonadetes bacterium]|nr:Mut7-C RNAse domain-containing protein [Armatimonadota bacterium]MDW8121752.1 Mut7-C RNAse domain-containing protein [Armatimonadota bacterium]
MPESDEVSPKRFIADVMLGKLTRWLRILGYDVAYDPHCDDEALVQRAVAEGRILLTKDRRLIERWRRRLRHTGHLLIQSDRWTEQLQQVVTTFQLDHQNNRLTRCPLCNGVLTTIDREQVRYKVPFFVYSQHQRFARCSDCGKIYWAGTHYDRVQETLRKVLG